VTAQPGNKDAGKRVGLHRVMLSKCSPYVYSLLKRSAS